MHLMPKSLLEQLPEIIARGRQQAGGVARASGWRCHAVWKWYVRVNTTTNAGAGREVARDGCGGDYVVGESPRAKEKDSPYLPGVSWKVEQGVTAREIVLSDSWSRYGKAGAWERCIAESPWCRVIQ